ncbi:MAG TPA: hypothetical protein VIX41_05125, partial [Acidimicrobiales bacterium]
MDQALDCSDEAAERCLRDVAPERLPLALAELHRALSVGGMLRLEVCADGEHHASAMDDDRLRDLLVGAGFEPDRLGVAGAPAQFPVQARRARTLPDTVGPGMRLLICG